MTQEKIANLVLRVGLAFAFLFPAIAAIFAPDSWIGYFPEFMRGIVPDPVLLHLFGLSEAVIALWILSGKKIFIPSLAAAGYLFAIVVLNLQNFEVVFRDLSIMAIAVYLALVSRRAA
jgi:hypothetical protein